MHATPNASDNTTVTENMNAAIEHIRTMPISKLDAILRRNMRRAEEDQQARDLEALQFGIGTLPAKEVETPELVAA